MDEATQDENGFWKDANGVAISVSASDLERHAYCPLSWKLAKEGHDGKGEAITAGIDKHQKIHDKIESFHNRSIDSRREIAVWTWTLSIVIIFLIDSFAFVYLEDDYLGISGDGFGSQEIGSLDSGWYYLTMYDTQGDGWNGTDLIMIDENKEVVNGDLLLTILSKYFSEKDKLNKDIVVSTVMSNYGFKIAMDKFGFNLIETPVGDKYVAEAMKKNEATLGGEQSGHIILRDYLPVGDGLLTCLLVLQAIDYFDISITEFRKNHLTEYPQKLTNIELEKSLNDEEIEFINQIALDMSIKLDLDGRYLIRNSGTEPLLRVLVEAKNLESMESFSDELLSKINNYLS